jgi:hypothetical protein
MKRARLGSMSAITGLVQVMIFSTALSRDKSCVHHYDPELKSQSLEYHHPTSLRNKKIQGSTFHWKMHALSFLGLQRHHSPGVYG